MSCVAGGWKGGMGSSRRGRGGAYARVVQTKDVAVTVFEGGDQALQIGHVVGELGGVSQRSLVVDSRSAGGCIWGLDMRSRMAGRRTLSNTVFISSSVKARIVAVLGVTCWGSRASVAGGVLGMRLGLRVSSSLR